MQISYVMIARFNKL